jgi:23S rRNA (uracil1939-C5)-methyltransferase
VQFKVEKLVYGGSGIARTEQGVVFVPKVLPGELVDVEIVDKKKDYSNARLLKVVEPSADRRSPVCPNFDTVGCCGWDHIEYARQLEVKESIIREVLRRHGKIEWDQPIKRITGPEREYRMRASFHVANTPDGPRLGFMAEGTNNVVAISSCAAFMPELNTFIADAAVAFEERGLQGTETVRAVVSPDTGQVGATFHRDRERASWTDREPRTKVMGLEYRLRAEGFFQPNRYLLEPMMSEVTQQCGSAKTVLDLFCGSAFFSLPIARAGANVTGVDKRSVANAVWNARHNEVHGVRFIKASAWAYLMKTDIKPDVVILDPPRTGAGKNIVKRVATLEPQRVVYISCNPTTLAPEARILLDHGYKLSSLKFIDQFPNTPHIETVSLFER